MEPDTLPTFRYHPDPVSTGAFIRSDVRCASCDRPTGWIYTGPIYSIQELQDSICPWCIADGSVAAKFEASFADVHTAGETPRSVVEEVYRRTPSYSSWQQDYWEFHCHDACEFLGVVGYAQLVAAGDAAVQALTSYVKEWYRDIPADEFLRLLDRDGQPTGYLFRCLHCREYRGHIDHT